MSWRNIIISNPARLSLKQNSIVIDQRDLDLPPSIFDIPLEDIAVVVIENRQVTVTAPLLAEMNARGVVLMVCDEQHIPCGAMLPFHQHSRMLATLSLQLGMSVPFCKNCWRLIVRQKILNQANCLQIAGLEGAAELRSLAEQVRSGDTDNREGAAAARYFERYFTALIPDSTRRDENHINAALNYRYSIIRGAVARALSAHGFLPALGIMHHNELNAFNLADDFIEPLRPVVDLWVIENMRGRSVFSAKERLGLVELLSCVVKMNCEKLTVLRAVDVMCTSFMTAARAKDHDCLMLPELLGIIRARDE